MEMDFDPEFYEDYDEADLMRYLEDEEYGPELAELLASYKQEMGSDPEYNRVPFMELYENCLQPTITQAVQNLMTLLIMCLSFRIVCLLGTMGSGDLGAPPWFLHLSSAMFGIIVLHNFFNISLLYLLVGCAVAYIALTVTSVYWRHLCGATVSIVIGVYIIVCEFLIDNTTWHMIRGAQMILSMKIISVSFDLGNGTVTSLPTIFEFLGYSLNVGTVVFGPWVSYQDYMTILEQNKRSISMSWVWKVVSSGVLSLVCLIHSTCFTQWLILDSANKWITAYRDAQSFRFSHYFVSYISETTSTLSGLGSTVVEDQVLWEKSVARPMSMELPRSLVDVVRNWNLPMHYWLKTYVFKSARPLGNFIAVLLTYAASSILHGLNFQLAAVLLSLGFYTYTEYVLRNKLSRIFNACIQARMCKEDCEHTYKYGHPLVLLTNVCLGLLSVFHLAYLGLMFDSSSEEEKGYTMSHTLHKWSALDYASHWTALGTFVFFWMI
ncbi:protein-serine O-palmitoleoyltransferase porcupine-like [Haliotis cracherodii]|uniref:protein-serine O-palmitoleoyltransferase porcupine-like n=1 Tax=Haliotis cracherodii TaxID=6455 RepID=UPI0039ED989D